MPVTIADLQDALVIPALDSATLRLDDCRRLTGPGLLWDRAGAVVDVLFTGFAPAQVTELWHLTARRVLDAIGWTGEQTTARVFDGGATLAISGPEDRLFTAAFAAETIWHFCAAHLLDQTPGDFATMTADLRALASREADPALIALIRRAGQLGLDVILDDEVLTLGHGAGGQSWPLTALPHPDDIAWGSLHNIPLALITGTNGKTTTTRLCAAIGKAAGQVSGLSSTDCVKVGDEVLDQGDYSGPAGARMLLRDARLQMGALEVARGGILRRGLPVRQARVAVVTNAAADHLGQYGINTVAELAAVKLSVHRALSPGGVMVLNADDAFVVAAAQAIATPVWWFSLSPDAAQIRAALAAHLPCGWLEGGKIRLSDGNQVADLIAVADIPITLSGAARYNILNALAAALACRALGVGDRAIHTALADFQSDPVDNPGRCNEFAYNGARVFVDFAHNPHSIAAVTGALGAVAATRKIILLGHAGDRSDQDIRDLTAGAFAMRPDIVVAVENSAYLRGRPLGEIPRLIAETCKAQGLADSQILFAPSPSQGTAQVLRLLHPGDLALLLIHAERDQIFAMLRQTTPEPVITAV